MTFLAFDPDRLRALVLRTRLLLVELSALPTDDPAAEAADRAVRSVLRTLELGLLPAVRRVLDSPPLRAPMAAGADLDGLPAALAREMVVTRGWAVMVDPVADDPTHITPEEVVALAGRLRSTEPREVVDDPELSGWVAQELAAVAADPALCRLFDRHFPAWGAWADLMAARRITWERAAVAAAPRVDDAVEDARRTLDRLVSAFARVAGAAALDGDHAGLQALPWLDDATPYAAAMFLGWLALPARRFTDLAMRILHRAPDPRDGLGDTTADLVLRAALANPGALTEFTLAALSQTDLLHLGLHHPHLLADALTRASAPDAADSTTAAAIVVPVLRAAMRRAVPSLRSTDLADLAAPWTVQLLSAAPGWAHSPVEGSTLLRAAVRSTAALERLIDRADVVVDGARRAIADGPARTVADFHQYLGAMGAILMNRRVNDTVLRGKAWDVICDLGGMATAFVPWAALGLAASVAVVVVHNQQGPDIRSAQADSLYAGDAALAQAGATVVHTAYAAYIRDGRLPADTPPPPEAEMPVDDLPSSNYLHRFLDWEDTLPGGADGPIGDGIRLALYSVISPWQVGEHVVWYVDGFPGT